MDNKVTYDTRSYTDIQSLSQLKYDKNTDGAKKEVAKQFEAILLQMVMSSMREANKAFSSGLFGSDQMTMYQDMFDKQLSLELSKSGVGFASIVEKSLGQAAPTPNLHGEKKEILPTISQKQENVKPTLQPVAIKESKKEPEHFFQSEEDFVKKLWSSAKMAAGLLGTSPEILIAQAALETNWGKKILPQKDGQSSFNLFNIKADGQWKDKTTDVASLEQKGDVLVKEKSSFRSYDSFMQSFLDYAHFLKNNNRYEGALEKASDPAQFIVQLKTAGYATDSHYAEKVLKIFSSHEFKNLVAKVKESI